MLPALLIMSGGVVAMVGVAWRFSHECNGIRTIWVGAGIMCAGLAWTLVEVL